MRRLKILSLVLVLAISMLSCKKSVSKMILDSDTIDKSKGFIIVKFSSPIVNSTNKQHWVCIVKEGSPDSTWGSWMMVPGNATQVELKFKEDVTEGKYEVRLHSNYPEKPYNVVDRRIVTIK